MNNVGVTNDILKALFTDECYYISHLNMKQCTVVIPKATELMNSKNVYHVQVGVRVIYNVL